jgi:hypothetical protein
VWAARLEGRIVSSTTEGRVAALQKRYVTLALRACMLAYMTVTAALAVLSIM